MRHAMRMLKGMAGAALLAFLPAHAAGDQPSVPYVPTPQAVVDRMLGMANVTAAKKYGTRGFGVDLNPVRIDEANENARKNRVTDKVAFYQRNLFETDLSQATVITMYLLPRVNLQLRPKLLDLKPGTRLVSHDFDMGDWQPDEHVRMDATDKFSGAGGDSDIYLWIVPAKVAGTWRTQLTAGGKPQTYDIQLEQKYQSVGGTVRVNGRPAQIQGATLRGAVLSFSFNAGVNGVPVKHRFSGRVDGVRIAGEAMLSGDRLASRVEWVAERTEAAR